MRKIDNRILIISLIVPISVLFLGCGERNAYKSPPPPIVTVSRPVRGPVTDYLELTGNTQAIKTVDLRARVEGYLEKVLFKDGDWVKEGQLLFVIQQNTYQAKLQQAEANVKSQQARLEHAETEFKRYSSLLKQRAASQTDVEQWRYERDASQASVQAAKAARDLAKLDLEYTQVAASFNGRIDRRLVDPGNVVGVGTNTVLATINQIDPIYVYFTINEHDLLHMMSHAQQSLGEIEKQNIPVYMGLANEEKYPHQGKLDFTAISVTPTTGTLQTRGIFSNPKGLIIPGMFARVRLPFAQDKSAMMVPRVALGFDQQGDYVLVVNEKNVVERRSIKLGPATDQFRVIEQGIRDDEWVVTDGLLRAVPGREVTPVRKQIQRPTTRPQLTSTQSTMSEPTTKPGRNSR